MVKVRTPLYLSDLGWRRAANWESFALITPTTVLCALSEKKCQIGLGVLVPGPEQ